jgi:hypothetical protein
MEFVIFVKPNYWRNKMKKPDNLTTDEKATLGAILYPTVVKNGKLIFTDEN